MASEPWPLQMSGRVEVQQLQSPALEGNHLGDPAERPLWVYVPPGYDDEPDRRYPSVYVIQGYTGQVAGWANQQPFRRPYPEAADAVFARGDAPPCIVIYVDAWTAYGGSQFVDSAGTGNYHTYLCDDVVSYVDQYYRTLPEARHRGIQGKSSGGFGAMITPMLRPDLFGGFATHAGDALYELCYIPMFPRVVRALREFDGSIDRWWDDFRSRPPFIKPSDPDVLVSLGVAACFSATSDGAPVLPFEPTTGQLRDEVWQRWLAWDPVRMVDRYAEALRAQRAIWIDAGKSDDFCLDLGAVAFRDALGRIGVTDVHFELFDGTHSGIDYRYPLSLAYLARRLAPE